MSMTRWRGIRRDLYREYVVLFWSRQRLYFGISLNLWIKIDNCTWTLGLVENMRILGSTIRFSKLCLLMFFFLLAGVYLWAVFKKVVIIEIIKDYLLVKSVSQISFYKDWSEVRPCLYCNSQVSNLVFLCKCYKLILVSQNTLIVIK